jgi:hypothetical protein
MPCVCVQDEVHLTDDLHVKMNMAAMTYVDMHQMHRLMAKRSIHPCNVLIQGQLGMLILNLFIEAIDIASIVASSLKKLESL